jgi:7-carboxy-7-deazaguanine synthase
MLALHTIPDSARHRVALLQTVPAEDLLIHEIYLSVQGESTFAGLPCVFIRTSVCDLRCTWCDTPHAFTQGERMASDIVLSQVLAYDCPLVELTGGEPLLQPTVYPLMTALADAGKTVLIETSGAHDVGKIDPRVHIIIDLKCPDSGEVERNYWPNLDVLKPTDQIKFVLASRRDWDWAEATIRMHRLDERFQVLISTVFGSLDLQELVAWILASKLNVRFQMQLHKLIWDPKTRGV